MFISLLVQPGEAGRVEGKEREHQHVMNCGEHLGIHLHCLQYFYKFGFTSPPPPAKKKKKNRIKTYIFKIVLLREIRLFLFKSMCWYGSEIVLSCIRS